MQILKTFQFSWSIGDHTATLVRDDTEAPADLTTACFAYAFLEDGRLVMSLEADRGWDWPGGHINKGETLIECAHRELKEEGGVIANLKPLGYIKIERHSEQSEREKSRGYPFPISYMQCYFGKVAEILPFIHGEDEDLARDFMTLDQIKEQGLRTNSFAGLIDSAYELALGRKPEKPFTV